MEERGKDNYFTFIYVLLCSIVPTAFMATTVIFVCFSLVALYAQRRAYLFLLGKLTTKQAAMKTVLWFYVIKQDGCERKLTQFSLFLLLASA